KYNIKSFLVLFLLTSCLLIGNISNAGMLKATSTVGAQVTAFNAKAGFANNISVIDVIGYGIQAILGLLGIIFLILILYAGFNWMTAAGDEEKVTKAKETLSRAIIGLVIIVSAYLITIFVFSKLPN
ncbi:hypothetical protein KKB33_02250, partial [Patescibacteria group bacterium]|nr:hypothetical protein [Patescibacteria group bacterium]